ncbi:MAG: hypothetical protein ABIG44_19060 [Planctomycetota bacterium]
MLIAILQFTESSFVSVANPLVVCLVAGAAFLLAWAGRRRLPVGVPESLFVTALSGLLLFAYVPASTATDITLRLAAVLTALAVLWHITIRWIERQTDEPSPTLYVRHLVGAQAVTLFGLVATGIALAASADLPARPRLALTLCLVILLALCIHRTRSPHATTARYAAAGLLASALWLWRGYIPTDFHGAVPLWLTALAVVCLLAAIGPAIMHWRYRRRVWQSEPERLIDPPADARLLTIAIVFTATIVAIGALLAPTSALIPIAVVLAALAVLTTGHRRGSEPLGALGLVLIGEFVILAVMAWLPTATGNILLGCALAGVYLLWLAGFWQQQLHDGVAWTTAGRLISSARLIGTLSGGVCVVIAVMSVLSATASESWPWRDILTLIFLVLLCLLLRRSALKLDCPTTAHAACLALLAAAVPAQAILQYFDLAVGWPVLIAGTGLLLTLLVRLTGSSVKLATTCNAFTLGTIPVILLLAIAVVGAYQHVWIEAPLIVVFFLGACVLRVRVTHLPAGTGHGHPANDAG